VLKENVYRIWGMFVMTKKPLRTSNFYRKALNRRGSTLLSALIMGVIVVIMIFSSAIYIRNRALSVSGSSNKMDSRIALDGMLAYTINGIKQNWCFTETWVQQPICLLTDARNTARLIISDESLNYIANSKAKFPTPISATRLSQITQTVDLGSINTNHPLYKIARPLDGKYSDVKFTIKRDDSAIASTKGREVRLRILVHLTARSGLANDDLDLDSQIIVYPRELSYFGLIMPGNLYLGSTSIEKGDISLNQVNSASGAGLRFESPVFVNKNLYLPPASNTTAMHNVIFLDKVVLGGGMIFQGNGVYSPSNAGGANNMYTHEMKSFSGLLGGYELDEARDAGLENLFGIAAAAPTLDDSDFAKCLKRIQASYDLKVTKDSQLFMRLNDNAVPNVFNLSASIGDIDNLIEQYIGSGDGYRIKATEPMVQAGTVDQAEGGAVFKVRVVFNGLKPPGLTRGIWENEFYLSRNGTVTLTPMGIASGAKMTLKAESFYRAGHEQFNEIALKVSFNSANQLDLEPFAQGGAGQQGVQPSIKVFLEGHDYAYANGENLRKPLDTEVTNQDLGIYKSNGISFQRDASKTVMQIRSSFDDWSTNEMLSNDITKFRRYENAPTPTDWAALDEMCMAVPETKPGSAFYASFPSADWGTSFATQAEHAWRFTPDFPAGYLAAPLHLDSGSNRFDPSVPNYPSFFIKSVVKDCIIEASANFVAGFYVCETLTIAARTEPLRIIGTFITGKLTIDSSAYANGIRWSSIYHPQALYELRAAKILGKLKGVNQYADCDKATLPPLWSPNLGITSALTHYVCNPVSLRTADPFKWTMVDPDCGIDPSVDPSKVACKSQPRRFLIKEISRTKGL
jgi:hypothetical protein